MLLRKPRRSIFAKKGNARGLRVLKALDLFSGAGGLTLGLRSAGFRVLGAVEKDKIAVETYKHNHALTYVWKRDVTKLSVSKVMQILGLRRGQLDLLAGCPPCQGFSELRTLNGTVEVNDPQNELLFEFLRFVKALRPKAIMMENVPALACDERIRQFLSEIAKIGYASEDTIRVCNAADYGVPQRRRRMILLTSRYGAIPFAPRDRNRKTVRQTIAHLPWPGMSADPLHDLLEQRSISVVRRIQSIPVDGGSRLDLGAEAQLPCHTRTDGFKDIYGRMAWDKVAPTITGGCTNPSKGRFLHPWQHRAITLREAALLQSFPEKYYISLGRGKNHAAQMIGNALPPEFIRRHAIEVRQFLVNALGCERGGNGER